MNEAKQGWIDGNKHTPDEHKGPFLVWDDTNYVWRLCHFIDSAWDEIRTGDYYPLRHTYYKELGIPEQVLPTKQ